MAEMEKNKSVTSDLKNFSISDISPVKLFDLPQERYKLSKGRTCLKMIKSDPSLKIGELQSIVRNQKAVIKDLRHAIYLKDLELKHVVNKLDTALKLLEDISDEKGNRSEVLSFLNQNSKKQELNEKLVQPAVKKKKFDINNVKELLAFDIEEPESRAVNRKRKADTQSDIDLNLLLKKPSKSEVDKEKDLDELDHLIRADQERFKKMEENWENDNLKKNKEREEKQMMKQKAFRCQEIIRNDLTNSDLFKLTESSLIFLSGIVEGNIKSLKHSLYHGKSGHAAQGLLFATVYEPFKDEQVDRVYELVYEKFQSVPGIEANYISWVLVSGALLKIFMDIFKIDTRVEAEQLIQICPLKESDLLSKGSSSPIKH